MKVKKKVSKSPKKKSTKKIFILDTNVILNDYLAPFSFSGQKVIIPRVVLKEVDKLKSSTKEGVGYNARAFARKVRKLISEQGGLEFKLKHGGTLSFELKSFGNEAGANINNDEIIINVALNYCKTKKETIILVTNDMHMAIIAHNLGIKVEGYEFKASDSFYTGVSKIYITKDEINSLYRKEDIFLDKKKYPNLHYNQILVLKESEVTSSSGFAIFKGYDNPIKRFRSPNKKDISISGITPLNKEQHFALEILCDYEVKCMTMTGRAGTGKSIISLAYGIQALEEKKFDKILIMKPIVPIGKDIGYLPGDLEEKMLHWTASFRDSLDVIFKEQEIFQGKSDQFGGKVVQEKTYDQLFHTGKIEFRPFTFIRGRNFQNTLIICDECLTKDSLVWTEDGKAVPIQEIENGRTVQSYNVDKKIWGKSVVTNFFERKTDRILRINTSSGCIECTPIHQLWVYEKGLNLVKKQAKDITRKDLIPRSSSMKHVVKNNLSIEESKFVALILADGHVEKNKNTIKVEMKKDQDWLKKTWYDMVPKISGRPDHRDINQGTLVCGLYNKKVIQQICDKHGIKSGRKANHIQVPNMIWNAPLESVKAFLSVCFDAEGDVWVGRKVEGKTRPVNVNFNSTSRVFTYQIQALLAKFDLKSEVYEYKSKRPTLGVVHRVTLSNFFAKEFFKKIGFTIKRKQDKYRLIKDEIYSTGSVYPIKFVKDIKKQLPIGHKSRPNVFTINKLYNEVYNFNASRKAISISDNIYNKIKKIAEREGFSLETPPNCARILKIEEEIRERVVYDFTADGDNTFVVNGVVSSNCQNCSPHEVKTLLTRASEGTEIILLGDIDQIDNPYLDRDNNGLSYLAGKAKDATMFGHIHLIKGQRGEISEWVANNL